MAFFKIKHKSRFGKKHISQQNIKLPKFNRSKVFTMKVILLAKIQVSKNSDLQSLVLIVFLNLRYSFQKKLCIANYFHYNICEVALFLFFYTFGSLKIKYYLAYKRLG